MQIHWYPGHMHKAQRKIREIMAQVDVMIEIVDARLPEASTNALLEEIRGDKPCLRVLNKADLADPAVTKRWRRHLAEQPGITPYVTDTGQRQRLDDIPRLCRELVPRRGIPGKPVRALIAGIPNVGKSTLINHLSGKKVAKTGNEPAVTKHQQKVLIGRGFQLLDTPGIMQPSPGSVMGGYRLAASGAIRATAMEYTEVALFMVDYLLQRYPGRLAKRYELDESSDHAPDMLDQLAARRGCIREGEPDLHRASEILLNEWRAGKLGRISLETPDSDTPYRLLPDPEPEAPTEDGD
ncbi:MAG: ribosome biogenesis GTPase YlqF [Natronospirillum sp.]|uniref:ribosome biogenesis GTPase YlqF n=1 Tax=Natronospirillum sp. TaxID=2812955 RepID=UPI0025F2649F|nr:ribosome biogenesis GTPase YlqF [Natronospirillum sp.]MCH8550939.1 ribosome biogenesis GTPase YlqF [Natronospirillum sp.]